MDASQCTLASIPLSIGVFGRQVVIDCVRKWASGAALDERERQIMDDALALNRFDMMQVLFADRKALMLNVECILPGDRADWLDLRRGFITASIAGALLNCHPYTTAYQIWATKTGRIEESTEENEAMRRGRLLEPVAVVMLREERPSWTIDYRADNAFYFERGLRIGATPDAYAFRPDMDGRGIVQFKTSSEEAFRGGWLDPETREVEVPLWIAVQAIIEAKMTGADWAAVAVLVVGRGIRMEVIDIPLHHNVWVALQVAVKKFWDVVEAGEHPPIDWDRDGSAVLDVNRWTEAKRIDLTGDETVDLFASNLEDTRVKRRELQKREDVLRAQILYALGSAEIATTRRFEILAPRRSAPTAVPSDKSASN